MPRTRKKKLDSELERLQRENRELKTLNRSLMKRLKKLDRSFNEISEREEESEFEEIIPIKERCPDCGKGILSEAKIMNRIFKSCSTCDYRSKAIKC